MFAKNTMTILIGNSDNKLTQQKWADFITELQVLCRTFVSGEDNIYFMGGSNPDETIQNYAIVISTKNPMYNIESFYKDLKDLRGKYNQDAVAIVEGKTKFI